MRGEPEFKPNGSVTAETDDPSGQRFEVRVRPQSDVSSFGLPLQRPRGGFGRLWDLAAKFGLTPVGPGEELFVVFANPIDGRGGPKGTALRAASLEEALSRALDLLETGSFPEPGEPFPL